MSSPDRLSILVPLDGTLLAASALPVARTLAVLLSGALHVAHVTDEALPPREARDRIGLEPDHLRGAVVHAVTGSPGAAIIRLADRLDRPMIVLCRRTAIDEPGARLGRVAEHVLGAARCPVVIVPPGRGLSEWSPREVMLPQDGTPAMAEAANIAGGVAERAGSSLIVLHVAGPGVAREGGRGALPAPRYVDQPQHEWPAWEREFLDRMAILCPQLDPTKLRFVLGGGDPGVEIARLSRALGVDLIVLGRRGPFEPDRTATLRAVLRSAHCPVLVARTDPGR